MSAKPLSETKADFEERMRELHLKARVANAAPELAAEVIAALQKALQVQGGAMALDVFDEACRWLERRAVWDWVLSTARTCSADMRPLLAISLFELFTDEPLDQAWLERLFGTWEDPALRWVLPCTYRNRPELLLEHLELIADPKLMAESMAGYARQPRA